MSWASIQEDIQKRMEQCSFSDAFIQQSEIEIARHHTKFVSKANIPVINYRDMAEERKESIKELLCQHSIYSSQILVNLQKVNRFIKSFNMVKDLGKVVSKMNVIMCEVDSGSVNRREELRYLLKMAKHFWKSIDDIDSELIPLRTKLDEVRRRLDALDKEKRFSEYKNPCGAELIAIRLPEQLDDLRWICFQVEAELEGTQRALEIFVAD